MRSRSAAQLRTTRSKSGGTHQGNWSRLGLSPLVGHDNMEIVPLFLAPAGSRPAGVRVCSGYYNADSAKSGEGLTGHGVSSTLRFHVRPRCGSTSSHVSIRPRCGSILPRYGFHVRPQCGHSAVPHPARFHVRCGSTNPPSLCPQFHARPQHPRSATMRFHVQFRNRRYRIA